MPIFIESSSVDYASFDLKLVNTFTDGKNREIPRRVPAAKGAVARPLHHQHPAEDRRYNPIDKHQALGRRGAGGHAETFKSTETLVAPSSQGAGPQPTALGGT